MRKVKRFCHWGFADAYAAARARRASLDEIATFNCRPFETMMAGLVDLEYLREKENGGGGGN
ncbi:MAG: hypothetical protein N3D11_15465 [Candidatus Sumerlaeia bacterium]|nr:hypothetical protein [Candidatus Sumerlaeia bacterium]